MKWFARIHIQFSIKTEFGVVPADLPVGIVLIKCIRSDRSDPIPANFSNGLDRNTHSERIRQYIG
jgi:hypothetical protein